MDVSLGGALLAGLISFVSPCVLPIVPPYLAYLAGVTSEEMDTFGNDRNVRRHVLRAALAFVAGFSTVFVVLGATASALSRLVARHLDILSTVAGLAIIVMGLHFLGVFRLAFLYREARVAVRSRPPGPAGAYLMGLAFAFGWTPCIGPVLATILAVAGSRDTVASGAALLAVYSIGIGLPFVLAALFAPSFARWAGGFRRHLGTVEKVMGGLLVLTGVAFLTGWMSTLSYWLLETFPALGRIG